MGYIPDTCQLNLWKLPRMFNGHTMFAMPPGSVEEELAGFEATYARHGALLQYGYGSIPIHTIFSGMNIHKSQLF